MSRTPSKIPWRSTWSPQSTPRGPNESQSDPKRVQNELQKASQMETAKCERTILFYCGLATFCPSKSLPKSAQFLTKCVPPLPTPILTPRNDSGGLWGETCGPFWEFLVPPLAPKGSPKGHPKPPQITPKSALQPESSHGLPQRAQKSKNKTKKV